MASEEIINEKLGAWLLKEGRTREKLADEIGLSRQTLSERLNGNIKWRWDEVIEISRITNTSLDELAGLR